MVSSHYQIKDEIAYARESKMDVICQEPFAPIVGKKECPDLKKLENMSIEELEKQKLKHIRWWNYGAVFSMGMTYTDGQTVGCRLDKCDETFSDIASVKKIKVTFCWSEGYIRRMQFYSADGKELLKMGGDWNLGREETFNIGADEELFGCEMHHDIHDEINGITWFKWRPPTKF